MNQGDIIGLKYRIVQKLGQGGSSCVYLSENLVLSNLWALKAIRKSGDTLYDEMKEVHILKNLSHPMLPRVADLLEDEKHTYIVMDYIEGETLLDLLRREGGIEESRLSAWAGDLCDVLAYLHGQRPPVIYRDLKPSNIILDKNGKLHLIDFGTAKTFKEEKTDDTVYIGTQGYAAPEQFGTGKSDERTDLFNLGMTLFHLASGIHPLQAPMEQAEKILREKGLSKGFASFIGGLVQTDPEKRVKSAKDCLSRIDAVYRKRIDAGDKAPGTGKAGVRLSIALTGVQHGVGTTLVGLSIARFFADKGNKTVFADFCQSGDLPRLEKLFNLAGCLVEAQEKSFLAEGILYVKEYDTITSLPRRDFGTVITDFGCQRHEKAMTEFNRADIKLVVCPTVDWKLDQVAEFINGLSSMDPYGEWIYVFPQGRPSDEKPLKNTLQIKNVLIFPFIQNPFHQNITERKGTGEALKKAMELSGMNVGLR